MAIDFPSSPSVGQQYTFGGTTYAYTSTGVWSPVANGVAGPQGPAGATGPTGATGPAGPASASTVRGLVGNASSSTAYAITFTEATLRDATGGSYFVTNGSFTADSAGAVGANGRDATLADGDLHLYAIKGAGAVAGIWSNAAPPTGPTLPSGYTNWCYLSSVKRSGGTIPTMIMRGDHVYYAAQQTLFSNSTVGGITTPMSYAPYVPALALDVDFMTYANIVSGSGALAIGQWAIGVVSGSVLVFVQLITATVSTYDYKTSYATLPNVNQTVYFGWTSINSPLSFGANLYILGYHVPNGD